MTFAPSLPSSRSLRLTEAGYPYISCFLDLDVFARINLTSNGLALLEVGVVEEDRLSSNSAPMCYLPD